MDRRAFVLTAAGALPLLAFPQTNSGTLLPPRAGFKVPAGRARDGQSLPMFDRSWIDFKISPTDTGGDFLLIEQRELRRFGPPRHVHAAQDEWFYPLAGTYAVEVGDEKFEIGPGDLLFAPRGLPHVWKHREEEPGRLLVAFQPAGKMEAFFRAFTAHHTLPAMPDLRALFHAHDMEITGPPLEG